MKSQMLNRILVIAALGLAPVALTAGPAAACTACGCSAAAKPETPVAPTGDLVETAASAGKFGTLLAAAEAAGLVDTLKSEGPLTLFAPTDKAFAALPEGTVESLLLPENKDKLVEILTFHVVAGSVDAKTAMKAGKAASVQGGELKFSQETHDDHSHAFVNGVEIIKTDIKTTNGMIHVINAVLLPSE
ncbi:MAG: fasciclin domain-containing protein [Planctomycetota bacterium]